MNTRVVWLVLAATLLGGCESPIEARPDAAAAPRDSGPRPPAEVEAIISGTTYAFVGESLRLDGAQSTGDDLEYTWSLGDGRSFGPFASPTLDARWDAPGRYQVILRVSDGSSRDRVSRSVTVTERPSHRPRQSSTIAAFQVGDQTHIAALSSDGDSLTVVAGAPPFAELRRLPTCRGPRTLTESRWRGNVALAIACQEQSAVLLLSPDGALRSELQLPTGSRAYGIVADAETLWVTLQGTDQLATVAIEDEGLALRSLMPTVADPRGIAIAPDGRVAISRWRSEDSEASVLLVDPASGDSEVLPLAFDPQSGNDSESGGIPNYLDQVLFSPNGREIAFPSTQANIGEGTFRNGVALTFETSVRAIVSFADLDGSTFTENFAARKLFDNRGLASAGVYSSRGDWLFVAMRGSRAIHRIDAFGRGEAGTILDTGFAPDGLALSADDRFLFVNESLSRRVAVYDVRSFREQPRPLAHIPTVDAEPLPPEILRGKQLFNDAADPRLTRDSYIACAHCHLDGDSDHRVWDFTDRGEGLRRTPPLFGRTRNGLLHWSGNFDEVQDFEHDLRGPFGGEGLLSDADFDAHRDTLGAPKAGLSDDLDALAAYVRSLKYLPSPHRVDGELSPAAARGEQFFENQGCPRCHGGADRSDSGRLPDGSPRLHDVGTLAAGSGSRLGQPLTGIDTPSLNGLWHQRRFLHDGSANLRQVLTTRNAGDLHGETSALPDGAIDDLVAFLLSLDGS